MPNQTITYQKNQLQSGCLYRASKSFLLLICLFACATGAHAQEQFIDSIKARIYRDLQSEDRSEKLDEAVTSTRKLLTNSDSCWSDMHYEAADPAHLERVLSYTKAYTNKQSRYYHNDWVYNCIVKTLSYWYKTKRVHWNWYSNVIGAPINTGQTLILMDGEQKDLPPALKKRLLAAMDFDGAADPRCKGGANQTDVALHYLYRGVLTRNTSVIDTAAKNSVGRIAYYNNEDGIQNDNSFFAHGPQEAIASYGAVYVYDQYNIAWYLHNTPYALKGKGLAILSSYYLNTYLRSIRNGYLDFDVLGRGVSRTGSLHAGHQTLLDEKIPQTDPANNDQWKKAKTLLDNRAAKNELLMLRHAHYWKADYVQHTGPLYSFNVRMSSVRTLRTEAGNKENLLGGFLPDGSTNVQRRGDEYFNIMPVWEWDKIPGTTAPDCPGDSVARIPKEWGIPGTSSFVGGVSDGKYGATAYDMQYHHVSAKKAWFFFDREVVCLGAGIKTAGKDGLITTINQCWLNGAVTVGTPKQIITIKNGEERSVDQAKWILHDSIGYFLPVAQHLQVSTATQTCSWSRIRTGSADKPVSGSVFKAWLEHKQANDSYAYIVVPGLADVKAMQAYDRHQIEILANTEAAQAVMHRGLDVLQVVLHKVGSVQLGDVTVKADQPCIIMLSGVHSGNAKVYVADPQQTAQKITVDLSLPGRKTIKPFTATMPAGVFAGSTAGYELDHNGMHQLTDNRNGIIE
ncbi:chondroitin AC lyase [Mucilaginibacter yixingensis]|uniref:Chondroitin AC lyase n=1 Tax=Mucilaginibacter yixingensis TaxID=1295612 RepID=A0A2T5J989_9SPHI|nr:polysaccharide lyase family 8 super-sandwich domain-containing protein [Mucilaginibacter yixingensis]PTQ96638.1 chondroitin AC lyase [Mucilaginibacter yixingensis]